MKKYQTDIERLEWVKRWKRSGLSVRQFALQNNLGRTALNDWVNAYNNIDGRFIRIDPNLETPGQISNEDVTMNLLSPSEIDNKSRHFTRFDHSLVVFEYKDIKITTSLEQAMTILERLYGQLH
ncbi:MAG TPA: hypothetical protein VJZ48_03670 [Bacilli bacterium]|jgi:hypothetical protein|nr:hypothetical protein [Bacilli bacterium]